MADILLVMVAVSSLLIWCWRRQRPSLRPLGLTISMGLVAGLAAVGAPHAPDPRLAVGVTIHLALLALLFLTLASRVVAPSWLAAALVVGLAVQVPLAIEQAARQTTSPLAFLLAWPGDFRPSVQNASVLLRADGSPWLRPYGPFYHPNILGGYLALELLLLIGLIVSVWPRCAVGLRQALLGLPVGFVLAGLTLSASRSAWIGAVAGLVAFCAFSWRRAVARRAAGHVDRGSTAGAVVLAGLIVAVALALLRPPLLERFDPGSNRLEQQSVQERLFFYQVGLQLLAAHPFLGVGAGNVDLAESIFFQQTLGPAPVHNVPLLMAVELGPLGALAWLLAAGCIVGQTWRSPGHWTVTFASALVAIGIAGLFDHYLWTFPVAGTTLTMLAGAWAAALANERPLPAL